VAEARTVLIVGTGSIGSRHVRCFQATGRVKVSICEIDPQLRRRVAESCGVACAYADLDEALGDTHDAVVIATPAHLHVPMAVRLAEAGLPLLIEKPVSTGLEGIDRLRAIVAQRNLVAMVAYVLRSHPCLRSMREAIRSGRFGSPVQLVACAGQHFPTYRPAYREIYYRDRATGGGAIQDALTHLMNAGQWLVGPMTRLVADAAHQVLDGVGVEDTVHVLARHGGVLASYSLNQHQAPNEFSITVVCKEGTARFEGHHKRWRWQTRPGEPWQEETAPDLERDDLFVQQAHRFLDVIEGRAAPWCTLDEGLHTLRTNLATLDSVERGTWETIEHATWETTEHFP
jgi:predicted dehydrogenase